jgi:hypothetical protein
MSFHANPYVEMTKSWLAPGGPTENGYSRSQLASAVGHAMAKSLYAENFHQGPVSPTSKATGK